MTAPAPAWPLTAFKLLLPLLLLPKNAPASTEDTCTFPDSPVSSTFLQAISDLSDYMLRDYPVDVPANLQADQQCWALWHLALAKGTLERLKLVAGRKLQVPLEAVYTEVNFVSQCINQSFPSCLRFRKANISHLLLDVSSHLAALQTLITHQSFQPCQQYRCQPEPSTVSTLPSPGSLGALGNTLRPPKPSKFNLLSLGVLPILLLLILVAAWRWKQRKRHSRPSRSPKSPTPQVSLAQLNVGGIVGAPPMCTDSS
ncbi:fms-related tyrosine kinase 3 ligand isoform X1 [Phascolarctos cinereus]|uniref:Fms-related tyrosine kinase 3 ligand isoform X1 n=1 Tax=Phascolarctos cinereus TaxID=38626 RepID=A0A6P5LN98_PHACI|nr:fms-related tyrosine kinase 3 ligand isoform X1 [Phascolarctos cinereus]XP_020858926.1 fms-related tyrosine kinase 3 ligand isoform X1 [Phascolarctos cinereus]